MRREFIKNKAAVGFSTPVHEKISKYKPIVIVGLRVEAGEESETEEKDANRIIVSCYLPGFFPSDDSATKDGDIEVNGNRAQVYIDKQSTKAQEKTIIEFVLKPEMTGKMIKMTGSMLRKYWGRTCPECGGGRSICPGCGGVSQRWQDCFASCGYAMPCPSCIGYGWAMCYKDNMGSITEDHDDVLDDIWRRVNEIDKDWLKFKGDSATK
ncbi:hypothetical protein C8J56DRAFT_1048485 [Mycena floridula]|nr:hypothetical protein C8J56DRAFT_1048485 [Mycena floridula]